MPTITIRDETTSGRATSELTLELLTETVTVRELIRSRVYQEVDDFNRRQAVNAGAAFQGLVQPTEAEAMLNGAGFRLKTPRQVDWRPQFEKACEAFAGNRILILVDDRQVTELEEELTLKPSSRVSFLKLVPLVGG